MASVGRLRAFQLFWSAFFRSWRAVFCHETGGTGGDCPRDCRFQWNWDIWDIWDERDRRWLSPLSISNWHGSGTSIAHCSLLIAHSNQWLSPMAQCPALSKIVMICHDLSKIVQNYHNLSKIVINCPKLSRIVQFHCSEMKHRKKRPISKSFAARGYISLKGGRGPWRASVGRLRAFRLFWSAFFRSRRAVFPPTPCGDCPRWLAVSSCPDLSRVVKFCPELSWIVQYFPELSWIVQYCQDLSWIV